MNRALASSFRLPVFATFVAVSMGGTAFADDHFLFDGVDDDCLDCHAADLAPADGIISAASVGIEEWFANQCKICHTDTTGYADLHHYTVFTEDRECLDCHALVWDPIHGAYVISNHKTNCFLECHTPMFYREESDGYLYRLTDEVVREKGWDIESSAKSRMADAEHYNFGVPSNDCSRCHAMEWNPDPGFYETVYVPGSAGPALDVNNIWIDVSPGLVHDIGPGDTLTLDASETEGDLQTVRWSINNQVIAYGTSFSYTFHWAAVGDTYVVKLEVWDTSSRYAKQNVVVNVR